jgi:hypothetical protein
MPAPKFEPGDIVEYHDESAPEDHSIYIIEKPGDGENEDPYCHPIFEQDAKFKNRTTTYRVSRTALTKIGHIEEEP